MRIPEESKPEERLYRIRHSLAHVMAQAVLEMREGSTLGFGPPIEDGFYYDFILTEPLAETDFPDLERRMKRILKKGQRFYHEELPLADAFARLDEMHEPYKREYAEELVEKNGLRDALLLPQRALSRHVRRPARRHHPRHRAGCLQAQERGRRVLAGGLEQRDDDPHLRLGVRRQVRSRRSRRGS